MFSFDLLIFSLKVFRSFLWKDRSHVDAFDESRFATNSYRSKDHFPSYPSYPWYVPSVPQCQLLSKMFVWMLVPQTGVWSRLISLMEFCVEPAKNREWFQILKPKLQCIYIWNPRIYRQNVNKKIIRSDSNLFAWKLWLMYVLLLPCAQSF